MHDDFRAFADEVRDGLAEDETEHKIFSLFKPLSEFEEQEAEWLVDGWIPKGQIALLGADGGVGKTTLWVNIVAALSSGQRCILDPPDYERTPAEVSFLTTEDSVRKKLAKKLRLAGACASNIYTPDFLCDTTGALRDFKFGSPLLGEYVRRTRHALYVFDPVQGFIPPDVNMGSRNAMRDCLAPLIALGEETGSSFLIVCHTNKRKGASGRDRLADSADLWDIARSVLMSGFTDEQGVRYLSNEKNNYSALQETVLFSIDEDGQIVHMGTSWKRDREYMQDAVNSISAPKREDCKEWLLNQLDEAGGELPTREMEHRAQGAGYSPRTLRRAKDELKTDGKIRYIQTGTPQKKAWTVKLTDGQKLIELPPTTWTPWNI